MFKEMREKCEDLRAREALETLRSIARTKLCENIISAERCLANGENLRVNRTLRVMFLISVYAGVAVLGYYWLQQRIVCSGDRFAAWMLDKPLCATRAE